MVFNPGIRLDQYGFTGEDTTGGPARAFWFTAFNHDTCYDTSKLTLYDKTALPGVAPIKIGHPCSAAGPQFQDVEHAQHADELHLQHLAAAARRDLHGERRHGVAGELGKIQRAAEFELRAIQRAAAESAD